MKICVTAANSFIGMPFVKKAIALNWDVIVVVRRDNTKIDYFKSINVSKIVQLNLNEYNNLGDEIGMVDCLLMLTWDGTRGELRNDAKLQESNFTYCLEGINSVLKKGCKKIITAGSQAEYGNINGLINEDMECNPNTEYGKYKLKLFNTVQKQSITENFIFIEPRFFSLYGIGDYKNSLIMSNICKMKNNIDCDMTECLQMWDYLYIDDAIDGLVRLCQTDESGVYNFGSGDSRKLKEYILEMKEILKSDSKLCFGKVPYGSNGVVSIIPNSEKLRKKICWKPKISFKQGVITIVNDMVGLE